MMKNPLMNDALAARGAIYFESVDSTNLVAKQLARQGAPHMTLVLADEQTAGRGRRGRGWLSRPGVGAWMTVIVRPDTEPARAPELVLVTAVALCRALAKLTGMDARIKWPNDVQCMGKKLSGTLLELSMAGENLDFAVIGVGVNILGTEFPPDLPDAASIESLTGVQLPRADVALEFLRALGETYADWTGGGMDRIMPDYARMSATLGQRVRAITPSGDVFGVAESIAPDGALMLRTGDGTLTPLYAGDVSIRPGGEGE